MIRILSLALLGCLPLMLSINAGAEGCAEKVNDLDKLEKKAKEIFGPNWQNYFPLKHSPQVIYDSRTKNAGYSSFVVQSNASGILEVIVNGDSYSGRFCMTQSGLKVEVLVLGGFVVAETIEIFPTSRSGEVKLVVKERESPSNEQVTAKAKANEYIYSVRDFSPPAIASPKVLYSASR